MRVIDLENITYAMKNETQFVLRCEEVFHDKISAAAGAILNAKEQGRPFVALAGPSGSGKTTTAMLGRLLAPLFAPLGFGDWRCATALVTGFIAKESVVSTLGILLGSAGLASLFTTRSAVSFLVFTLLYTPCVAAISAIRREVGSSLRAGGIALSQCCIAWIAAFIIYQIV